MAVFPDRIVLKNSTDSDSAIRTAIGSGGSDAISQGELVLGIQPTTLTLYSVDGNGNIISFTPTSATGRAIVSSTAPTLGINGEALEEGDLWFNSTDSSYHVYYNSAWVEVSGQEGGVTRTSVSVATSSLADQASEDVAFTATGKSGTFVTVQTDVAAWVTFYTDTASRTSDSGRSQTTSPDTGSGVLLEVITTGAQTIRITPAVSYFNDDTVLSSDLVAKVVNISGGTSVVNVTVEVITLEA